MYTSVVSHKRGIGKARVSVRKWKHAIRSESLEPARQFRKKSEILCPPSSLGRQCLFMPFRRNPLEDQKQVTYTRVHGVEKARWGETVGIKFRWRARTSHYYHSDCYPPL